MGLNIKKPNYLNSSLVKTNSDNLFYNSFLKKIEASWFNKNLDINKANDLLEITNSDKTIKFIPDALKNLSLITYIDAPWGSGKTYFIESFLDWKSKNNNLTINFKNKIELKKIEIDLIDAWEIYNKQKIEDILIDIFKIDYEKFKEWLKNNKSNLEAKIDPKTPKEKRKTLGWKVARTISIPFYKTLQSVGSNFINIEKFLEAIPEIKEVWEDEYSSLVEKLKLKDREDKSILNFIVSLYIEDLYKDNNKIIVLDNIERLSSKNRLDVINKILNWANISGITFIFLTNFEKIKISSVSEEDFWNKISLYETFKLENDWKLYLDEYEHKDFTLKNHQDLLSLIKTLIPSFFDSNKDDTDIREIKKLLDNWNDKHNCRNEKELIISFIKEAHNHLEGLSKHFFTNKTISELATDKYWNYFKKDFKDEQLEKRSTEIYIPLINNKMFRIQSNFYELKLVSKDNVLKFDPNNLKIRIGEDRFFNEFNNFVDDNASTSFKDLISELFSTRRIENSNHLLNLYMKMINEDKISYFEFKYNNLRKIHIYNEIFTNKI